MSKKIVWSSTQSKLKVMIISGREKRKERVTIGGYAKTYVL
jgi:hypothetical protein